VNILVLPVYFIVLRNFCGIILPAVFH